MKLEIGHIGLNVSDLTRSVAFYGEIFELKTIHEHHDAGKDYAFLSNNDGLLLTLWRQSEGEFSTQTPGLHHLALQVESVEEVRAFEEKLRASSVPLIYDGLVAHAEGADSGGIYFLDPDGIRLEVCVARGVGGSSAPTPGVSTCGFF